MISDGIAVVRPLIISATGFGDVAVLTPLAAVLMIWLLLKGSFRCAGWWAISVLSCAIVIFVLKLVFYQCPPTPQLHNPSGHTGLSMLVYGAITLVTAAETKGVLQKTMLLGGICLILAIAISRLLLHVHSLPEVAIGLMIGAGAFSPVLPELSAPRRRTAWVILLIAASAIVAVVLRGRVFDGQTIVQNLANYFRIYCA
jgi:membrane-associated phospholipid phosphatase